MFRETPAGIEAGKQLPRELAQFLYEIEGSLSRHAKRVEDLLSERLGAPAEARPGKHGGKYSLGKAHGNNWVGARGGDMLAPLNVPQCAEVDVDEDIFKQPQHPPSSTSEVSEVLQLREAADPPDAQPSIAWGSRTARSTKDPKKPPAAIRLDRMHQSVAYDLRKHGEVTIDDDFPPQRPPSGDPNPPDTVPGTLQAPTSRHTGISNASQMSQMSETQPAIAWAIKNKPTTKRLESMGRQLFDRKLKTRTSGDIPKDKKPFSFKTKSTVHASKKPTISGKIVDDQRFEIFIIVCIIINTICLGAQVQWNMHHIGADTSTSALLFDIMEDFFTVIFTFELILRGFNERRKFFATINPNFWWNVFDFVLILSSLSCRIMTIGFFPAPNMSFLRLFRVLRVFRAFRMIRIMRFFSDVRIMVAGIIRSLQSLAWALLLLSFIMYIVAVCVMQLVQDELQRLTNGPQGNNSSIDEASLMEYYGSLQRSFFTLYLSISGGIDWGDAITPLMDISVMLVGFYCLYIAFAVFCVLNVITGVFVDNATKLTAKDEENVLQEEIDNRMHWFKAVQSLFAAVDDGSGHVTLGTFHDLINDIEAQAAFSKIGIELDVVNVDNLFKMLDFDNSGSIDIEEFVAGIEMYHGSAKRIDVSRLMHETRKISKQVRELAKQSAATQNLS